MKWLWRNLLSLLFSASVAMAAGDDKAEGQIRIFDPFQTSKNLACAQDVFFAFIGSVLDQVVVGEGPITILTMQAATSVGTEHANDLLFDFALQVEKLRGLNLQSAPFKRAWERVTHNEKPYRLVICLLSDGCVVNKERGAVYIQFSVDPNEIRKPTKKSASGGGNKKKAASKGSPGPKKASRMKVEPRSKRGEPKEEPVEEDEVPASIDESVQEIIIDSETLPRLLVVNHTSASAGIFSEATLLNAVARSIVRYNEDLRFEHWLKKNKALTAAKRDPLFKAVKDNLLKFHRLMMAAQSVQVELEINARYLNGDRVRELEEAGRQYVFLQYELLGIDLAVLTESEINEKNVLELFEALAATYFTGP